MKKVVVTGGAGFIGSHLAEELRERGHSVIIIDNLSTGRKENIASLINSTNSITPQTQGVEFIQGSTTNLTLLQEIFKDVQYVFHQAAIASVPQSLEDPLTSNQANLTGTLNVLLAARDNGAKKVIYASSCAVYGDSPVSPKREDMLPAPLSPYAVAKLAGEYYCQVFQEVYGLPTACLRYFNVFGPRQDPGSQYAAVIPKFISRVSEGNSPVVFGDGEQTRDFVFVRDVVEANILIAEGDATGVFNIGRGESVSINQLAELIIGLVGNSVEPIHEEPRPGDIRHSLADISKAKSFGYEPKYSLEEGLVETIEQVGG